MVMITEGPREMILVWKCSVCENQFPSVEKLIGSVECPFCKSVMLPRLLTPKESETQKDSNSK